MTERAGPDAPYVGIIGGGYAGLACGVELMRRGARVAVFESSRTLGGRARVVHKNDMSVDNGQHILIGGYTETLRLMRQVGVRPSALAARPLDLFYPGRFRLQAARLPAPLHLAVGLLRAEGMSWPERRACLRFIQHLKAHRFRLAAHLSVAELLDNADQPERLRRFVWEPLCLAALNTPVEHASARVFANVLRDSLAAGAGASELLIPKIDLSELFPVPAARWLGRRGGSVYITESIKAIVPEGDRFRLEGDPMSARRFDHVVVATAPYHASRSAHALRVARSTRRVAQGTHLRTYPDHLSAIRPHRPPAGADDRCRWRVRSAGFSTVANVVDPTVSSLR